MNAFQHKHETEVNSLRTEAGQLLSQLEQVLCFAMKNNAVYEQEAQNQLQELEQLSEFLSTKIEGEIVQRKEKEKQERTDLLEQITTTLKNDVPSLMNEVIEHSSARQQEE